MIVFPPAGKLDEALEKYKLSKQFGVERAAVHIRNVSDLKTLSFRLPFSHQRINEIYLRSAQKSLGRK